MTQGRRRLEETPENQTKAYKQCEQKMQEGERALTEKRKLSGVEGGEYSGHEGALSASCTITISCSLAESICMPYFLSSARRIPPLPPIAAASARLRLL